ncbi:HEAT repeat domain-containing protein [Ktedonospora formicarum]|uniref:HEAT repeat domain-containing protein n=1 Tax=Ktedonospora formicarum TaxID=2778364 RepID=A0A8J3MVQ6_9CHLR|nr:hypothetical protein [Ktedonospora formicarum]GHO47908.1 hypothetical protein KSX_60710 [Ktedonospora formicarum]
MVLPALARLDPDLGVELVRASLASFPLHELSLQSLIQQRPNEIADLIIQLGEESNIEFDNAAPLLNDERLLTLWTRFPGLMDLDAFERYTPRQRLALYNACGHGWRMSDGTLSPEIVAYLPAEQRAEEARRHMKLPVLQAEPERRLDYAAYLPWDEARVALTETLNTPNADLRGASLKALITVARYERGRLGEVLKLVLARRNEQDPVRYAMLEALMDLPHSAWQAEHLPDLAGVIHDTLAARDLSSATASEAEELIVHLLPFHPEWCAQQLAELWRARGYITTRELYAYLSEAHVPILARHLAPVLRQWRKQENEYQLYVLANTLGHRLHIYDELVELLADISEDTRTSSILSSIIYVLEKYQPKRLRKLIPHLLEKDPSCITIPEIHAYVHLQRQDLLPPFLGRSAYKGRFSTGKTRFVIGVDSGFYRWTSGQQESFAQTLLEIARDKKRATYEVLQSIARLASMPALDAAHVVSFANDKREAIRDAALQALGRLDAGRGIPTLLEAMGDERARIAIYALRKAVLSMPTSKALATLRQVPMQRVTVAKEAIRLIGELETDEAYRELLAQNQREDLHRDVRVALLRALWPYLDRQECWEIFSEAAHSEDSAIAQGIMQIPADGLSRQARARLVSLLATLLEHPDAHIRQETLRRCVQSPVSDKEHVLYPGLLALLSTPLKGMRLLAANVALRTYAKEEPELIGEAIRGLLSDRRALHSACEALLSLLRIGRGRLLPATRTILNVLESDPLTITLRAQICVAGLPWSELEPALVALVENLHSDALAQTAKAIEESYLRPEADHLTLEAALSHSEDERLRRLGLSALLAQTRRASGWSDECIARLERYCQDPSSLVAEKAQFTFPPQEEPE